ncbi:phosphatase PAP2 family protein [Ureibacillus composti]|nr:phosphatase PAP2 family protein [Ureibacillus composti]
MNKWIYISAICAFIIFCILWMTFDTPLIKAFDQGASDLLYGREYITVFHYIGETKFIFSVAIILLLIILIRLKDYKLMLFEIMSVGFGYAIYQVLKRIVERPRPEIVDQFTTFSFPSGHALHGFLYLVTVAYVFNRMGISKTASRIIWTIAILLFLLIGLSRIAEGRHYASDVLAGWMLGYSWFILCVWWYESAYRSTPDRKEI